MQAAAPITFVKTVGERLRWARKQRGMTQQQVATAAGVSQGTIGNAESGAREKPRELNAIAAALKVNVTWAETGRGQWDEASNVTSAPPGRRVPIISWVQAGTWAEVQDNFHPGEADEWAIAFDTLPGNSAFALVVEGDSMTNPIPGSLSFPAGTVIIVDPDRGAGPGDFVVAKDVQTQRATFKKLVHDAGRWYLRPLNPAYPTLEIDDPGVRVIGRVIEYQTRGKL